MYLKIYHLDPVKYPSAPGLVWQASLKKTEVKLKLLTDTDMLLMVEKGIRGGIYHTIHQYARANYKYMKDYDKNKESSYLKYWDVNNLYDWAVSQKLPVNKFEWTEDTSQFNEDFLKDDNEESEEGYFLEADIQYPENALHNDLPFLQERMTIENVEKLVTNLHDKTEYVIHIRKLKQALNHGLILRRFHRVIKVYQKAWLKPYIDIKTKLKKQKVILKKTF